PRVDEDAPAFHPDQGEDMVRVPRIMPQPFPRLDLVLRQDDQEAAALLVQGAAELDEPLRDEAIDERGVLVPVGLFARIPGEIALWTGRGVSQEPFRPPLRRRHLSLLPFARCGIGWCRPGCAAITIGDCLGDRTRRRLAPTTLPTYLQYT